MKHNILIAFLVMLALAVIGLIAYVALKPDRAVAPVATEQKTVAQKAQPSTPEKKTVDQPVQKEITSVDGENSKEQNMKEIITVPSDWKKYRSPKYGFSFSFPVELAVNTDESTNDNIVVSDIDDRPEFKGFGKWQYNISVKSNTKNLTLQNITDIDQDLQKYLVESSKSGKEIVTDVMVGGEKGKYYKVCASDGMCKPMLIYVIHADNVFILNSDSSEDDLLTLASSFVFEK